MLKGIVWAVIGGCIAAAAWALIAFYTNYEAAVVALGVGVLVGKGMQYGLTQPSGRTSGAAAGLIALIAIAAGKLATVELLVKEHMEKSAQQYPVNDETCKIQIGFALVEEREQQGKKLAWPDGMNSEKVEKPQDFPAEIWKDAQAEWAGLTDEERAAYLKQTQEAYDQYNSQVTSDARTQGFIASFSLFDAFWAFCAITAAYGIGCTPAPKRIS